MSVSFQDINNRKQLVRANYPPVSKLGDSAVLCTQRAKVFFWALVVLIIATLLLAVIFCYAEGSVQPDKCSSFTDALLWVIASYADAPGCWADYAPLTNAGQIVSLLVVIIKASVFSMLVGLATAIFNDFIKKLKRKRHLEDCRRRMAASFRPVKDKATSYRVPPRYLSVARLQVKKQLTEKDIMDTVAEYPEFRLRNLSATQKYSERPFDRLVVERLPLGEYTEDSCKIERTSYGIKIDRSSKITIIAPTAATECTIGYFAYHVAFLGGFNFVSREFARDDEGSYYTISDSPSGPQNEFVSDIRQLSSTPEHWNIAMISSANLYDTQVHLVSKVRRENWDITSSVRFDNRFRKFFVQLQAAMQRLKPAIRCDADEIYKPVTTNNVIVRAGGGRKNNGFTMRVSYRVTTWNDHIVSAASSIAETILRYLEEDCYNISK